MMMSVITGRTPHEEASTGKTFDLVQWIRARRLAWLGHILRMGTERSLKRAVFVMFKSPREGDLLMDAPRRDSWRKLSECTMDRERWRARVRALKQPRVRVQIGSHVVEESGWLPFTVS